jgi:uncharacterized damage-inducible protein DinB
MTDHDLTGPDVLRAFCAFRNGTRPTIAATIAAANPHDVYRPGVIPGGVGDGSVFAAYVHIVDVEESWLRERLMGEGDTDGSDPERYRDIAAVTAIWEEVGATWSVWLAERSAADLEALFRLGRGTEVPTYLVVMHVFNHTTHHRAEIWSALTSFGMQPPELDVLDWAAPRT